jgi:TetR/AcrR family transcriptional regulator
MVSQRIASVEETGSSRESILDSATEVFMESGFSGARVDEIARRAKANKAMIYYHFGSKQDLYRAVLLRLFGDVLAEISRLQATEAPPREKLQALYTRIAAHFEAKRALPHIMLREILAGGKSIDAEASRTLFVIVSFVAETIREGVRTGEFREVDPLLLHMSVLAPLMVHHVGDSFRERILPREMPGVAAPRNGEMLQHLLTALDRSLAPATPAPSSSRS